MQIDILASIMRTKKSPFSLRQEDLLHESIPNEKYEPKLLILLTNSFVSNMKVDQLSFLRNLQRF